MSAQNNLKKPVFTKSVMGYTPKEVDQYIEYMNERYAALRSDVAELKRRLTRFQLGLDRVDEKENVQAESGFSDAALDKFRHMIASERSRHGEALDALLSFIETYKDGTEVREKAVMDMSDDGFVPLDDDFDVEAADGNDAAVLSEEDAEWEQALESFIAGTAEDEAEGSEEEAVLTETEEIPVAEEICDAEAEAADEPEREAEPSKTPAQLALELDFYSDDVVRDGESYDPMTLAQNATMQRKRPSFADFMNPLGDGEKPKRK